jgi:hypothetical protein
VRPISSRTSSPAELGHGAVRGEIAALRVLQPHPEREVVDQREEVARLLAQGRRAIGDPLFQFGLLHLELVLRVAEGHLRVLALGHVVQVAVPGGAAVRIAFGHGVRLDPDLVPLRVQEPELLPPRRERGGRLGDGVPHAFDVVRMDALEHGAGIVDERVRFESDDPGKCLARVREPDRAVRHQPERVEDARHRRRDPRESILELAAFGIGSGGRVAFGEVLHGGDAIAQRAGGVADAHDVHLHRELGSVAADHPGLVAHLSVDIGTGDVQAHAFAFCGHVHVEDRRADDLVDRHAAHAGERRVAGDDQPRGRIADPDAVGAVLEGIGPLPQRRLVALALRDVDADRADRVDAPGLVEQRELLGQVDAVAGGPDVGFLEDGRGSGVDDLPIVARVLRSKRVRIDVEDRASDQGVAAEAVPLLHVGVDQQEASVEVLDPDRSVGVIGEIAQQPLAFAQRGLQLSAMADVLEDRDESYGGTLRVAQERRRELCPHDLAVRPHIALLGQVTVDFAVQHRTQVHVVPGNVVGVGDVPEIAAQKRLPIVADDQAEPVVDGQEAAVGGQVCHADGRAIEGRAEQRVRVAARVVACGPGFGTGWALLLG